jgi:hypothetical protein
MTAIRFWAGSSTSAVVQPTQNEWGGGGRRFWAGSSTSTVVQPTQNAEGTGAAR